MGSKTYDDSTPPVNVKLQAFTESLQRTERPGMNQELQVEEDDDDPDEVKKTLTCQASAGAANDTTKKKKKKNKRKKSKAETAPQAQSDPPRVPLSKLVVNNKYNEGQILLYDIKNENNKRVTSEETRYLSRLDVEDEDFLNNYRKAAEVHRQVRGWVQRTARPGVTLTELALGIEDGVRALLDNQGLGPGDGLKSGLGFPTGLALNNCAAHYTPNPGSKDIVLQHRDVLKVDFGVHISGWIVDSAFTIAFDPVYDNLLAAVKDATNTGIQNAGIDARVSEIGALIQECMESYEVELNRKTYPVKAIRNITGHNIGQYRIHAGKSVPFVKNNERDRMEEGEVFAIETFGSTGTGVLRDDVGVYGYGKRYDAPNVPLSLASARSLLKTINDNFKTLVFSRRSLERLGVEKYHLGLNRLVSSGILQSYAPLSDVKGSYTAQFEHTILLRSTCKEVVSRGEDY